MAVKSEASWASAERGGQRRISLGFKLLFPHMFAYHHSEYGGRGRISSSLGYYSASGVKSTAPLAAGIADTSSKSRCEKGSWPTGFWHIDRSGQHLAPRALTIQDRNEMLAIVSLQSKMRGSPAMEHRPPRTRTRNR